MREKQVLFLGMWGTAAKTRTKQAQPVGTWDMMVNFKLLDIIRDMRVKYIFIITTHEPFGEQEKEDRFNTTMDYVMFSVEEYLRHDMHSTCANTLRAVDAMFAPEDGPSEYILPQTGMMDHINRTYKLREQGIMRDDMLMVGCTDVEQRTAQNYGISYESIDEFTKKRSRTTDR